MAEQKTKNKIKVIIIVLSVLLAVSFVALAGTLLYNHFFGGTQPTSVTVPDNIITPEESTSDGGQNNSETGSAEFSGKTGSTESSGDNAESIAASRLAATPTNNEAVKANAIYLHSKNADDNTPFEVGNIFPGDSETKYFCVRVSHKGDVVMRYHADIRPGCEKLAEVMNCRIVLPATGETLYDGLMRDMPKSLNCELKTDSSTTSELYYEITAYLDSSVGNDYQNKDLIADFRWWVEETEHLDSPQTGDNSNILLWLCLACGFLIILIVLLAKRWKEEQNEQC